LYAVGQPTPESPVLVSANYKLSFDRLRSQLQGLDAWVLTLDTRGVNVWCAAGKGTFGTDEIVERARATRLADVVTHRCLVVPQLGAPGVSAHDVSAKTGFHVAFGPVRAEDLPDFLRAGMKATAEMRRVRFPFRDRVVLIPMELVMGAKWALIVAAGFLLLAGLGPGVYSPDRALVAGIRSAALFLAMAASCVVLTPALLPWLPGRAFAAKGAWLGLALTAALGAYAWFNPLALGNHLTVVAWLLIAPAVASFTAMNFTGASTYTSLSGVQREMRVALPIQASCAVVGVGLWLAGRFF
jgi:acetyl-CoA decarbonylase/synthase complex subunit gamma